MKIIGVDIGGTKIEAGLVDEKKLINSYALPTPAFAPKDAVAEAVNKAIDTVFTKDVTGIGIGIPGLVDFEKNEVIDVVNIPSWNAFPLQQFVQDHFQKPVLINNDANCFAIGEAYFGKGKSYKNFVGVTIGTGLGAGIIINGHLYSGSFCGAGEFGSIYYLDKTVEAYASGQFFKDKKLNGEQISQLALAGNEEAVTLYNELGIHIGHAIANILFALAPEAIILGGSVSQSYKLFEKAMYDTLEKEFPYKHILRSLQIEISNLKNSAVLGAASLFLDKTSV